jgi:histidinol-phosphate/aromatic aminotransferase/cobyric acid decarboxylase-like protein
MIKIEQSSQPNDTIKPSANNRLNHERMTRNGLGNYAQSGQIKNRHSFQKCDLIESISRYTGLPEEFITPFGNPADIRETIALIVIRPGDNIIITGPADISSLNDADNFGAQIICHYGASPFSADVDGLLEKVNDRTALISLANPNSPTGTVYSQEEILQILETVPMSKLFIDESFFEYGGISAIDLVRRHDNLIIMRTFTEGFGLTGNPCSYLLTSPSLKRKLTSSVVDKTPSETAVAAAVMAISNLNDMNQRMEQIRENMIFLSVRLRALGISCRMTPLDLFLVKVNDTRGVISSLKDNDIFAADLSYLPQLENYISIHIRDDAFSIRLIEAFENMPSELYRPSRISKTKITLHRSPEENIGSGIQLETVDSAMS